MEGEIEDLVEVLFKRGSSEQFCLGLDGVDTTKELFQFCIDLLSKGITKMYGVDTPTKLSQQDFEEVASCMRRAGIVPKLELLPEEREQGPVVYVNSMADISKVEPIMSMSTPAEKELNEYAIIMRSGRSAFKLSFELKH